MTLVIQGQGHATIAGSGNSWSSTALRSEATDGGEFHLTLEHLHNSSLKESGMKSGRHLEMKKNKILLSPKRMSKFRKLETANDSHCCVNSTTSGMLLYETSVINRP